MIIQLKRLIADEVLLTKFINVKATGITRSYDSYRVDLPDTKQAADIEAAGYDVDHDTFYITMGQFIDNLHKINDND